LKCNENNLSSVGSLFKALGAETEKAFTYREITAGVKNERTNELTNTPDGPRTTPASGDND